MANSYNKATSLIPIHAQDRLETAHDGRMYDPPPLILHRPDDQPIRSRHFRGCPSELSERTRCAAEFSQFPGSTSEDYGLLLNKRRPTPLGISARMEHRVNRTPRRGFTSADFAEPEDQAP